MPAELASGAVTDDVDAAEDEEEQARLLRIERSSPPPTTAVEPGESLLEARRRLETEQQAAETRRRATWEGLGPPRRGPEPAPDYETTWNGGEGLSSYVGGSSLPRR